MWNQRNNILHGHLPGTQCGLRPNGSTVDTIYSIHQVQEKCLEQSMDLYAVFIELTKAFNRVNGEALWIILSDLGCPDKFVSHIRQFHDDMSGQVLSGGEVSEPFNINSGIRQGFVFWPWSCSIPFFACILSHATRDLDLRVHTCVIDFMAHFSTYAV